MRLEKNTDYVTIGSILTENAPVNGVTNTDMAQLLQDEVDSTTTSEETLHSEIFKPEEWTILECNFGIPLFDESVNYNVCQKILNHKLSWEENLTKLRKSSRILVLQLFDFISDCQEPSANLDFSKSSDKTDVPQPTKNILFCDGILDLWSPAASQF